MVVHAPSHAPFGRQGPGRPPGHPPPPPPQSAALFARRPNQGAQRPPHSRPRPLLTSPSLLSSPPTPPLPDDAKAKAAKAAKTVKKNTHTKKRRVRTSVVFHRPRTLQLARTPKFPRQR